MVSIHEAGHAVVEFALLGTCPDSLRIEHERSGSAVGAANPAFTVAIVDEALVPFDVAAPDIQSSLGGVIGEALVTDRPRWELAQADLALAIAFGKQTTECALSPDPCECLESLVPATMDLLAKNWDRVVDVADELSSRRSLSAAEVRAILARGTDP